MEEREHSFSSSSSLEGLEELDWDGLLEICKEKDEKLNLAGTYGLKLHEQLSDAQTHIEEMRIDHENEMEKLVQETFELRNKLKLKEKSLSSHQHEFEEYQKQASVKHHEDMEETVNIYKKDCASLKKDKDVLASDLEHVQLREQHALQKIQRLEEKILDMQGESKKKPVITSPSVNNQTNLMNEEKIHELEDMIEKHKTELQDLQNENQSLSLELKSKTSETVNLQQEVEEAETKSTSYYNHLQKAREETTEMKAELDTLKSELRNNGHMLKGNSLFGEVDDERKEMKKKLSSFQIKYESLSKAHAFLLTQNRSMKAQVVALLQMNSGKADVERISHLQRALSQANAENLVLTTKLKEAESKKDLSSEGLKALASTLPDFDSNRDMIDFLMIQINQTKEKMDKQREEFDYLSMVKLAESEKLMKSEQKLYESDCLGEKYRNENMKLRLKLEETKNKLNAETQKRIMVEKKFNYDSKDDPLLLGVATGNQTKEKRLPYTLAKAQERANEKSKALISNSLWDTNSKQTPTNQKTDLHFNNSVQIHRSDDLNKENISTNHDEVFDDGRLRRVSFKDDPETIPESNDETLNEKDSTLNDTATPNHAAKIKTKSATTTSALKKKTFGHQSSLHNNIPKQQKIATKRESLKPAVAESEQECKMQ